jgi:hydantoinase/carbamoylase family amidase
MLLLGSHIDSVPRGGRFDGALGVLAAHEVLRAVRDAGIDPGLHLEAIDFTDEEGTLLGLLGSRAVAGTLTEAELSSPRCGKDLLDHALRAAGLTPRSVLGARRDPESLAGFLELHIEQGPRLAAAGASIGIVETIVGIRSFEVALTGRADHSGTTPMDDRRDAGLGAAALIQEATRAVRAEVPDGTINFGRIELAPGAFNIVPERAVLALELRAPEAARLDAMERRVARIGQECAARGGLEIEMRGRLSIAPVPCDARVRAAIAAACRARGLRALAMGSGAGHDTGAMAAVCPSGMLFIPSTGGSHSHREHARWEDCVAGADVLLSATLRFAASLPDGTSDLREP